MQTFSLSVCVCAQQHEDFNIQAYLIKCRENTPESQCILTLFLQSVLHNSMAIYRIFASDVI